MRVFLFLCGITLYLKVSAQDFQITSYRVKDGLPTDIVKSVTEDSLGFLWIASDEGLIKFDGSRFTHFKKALHSQYAKSFIKNRAGEIYLIGDLDLIKVNQGKDTSVFESIRQGTRNPVDTALWYPKSIFEDNQSSIWIGEPQSVLRIQGRSMQRFSFGREEQTPEFLRSFSFFEDVNKILFCVTYFGRVYQFKPEIGSFVLVDTAFPSDVKDIKVIDQTIWIAAYKGLYKSKLKANGSFSPPELAFAIKDLSCILPISKDRLFIGTTSANQYIIDLNLNRSSILPFEINNVNSAFLSSKDDLWLSSNDGLVLLQENLFGQIRFREQETFIESIAEDANQNTVFYASITKLFSSKIVSGVPTQHKVILTIPRGYFQGMQLSKIGLWVSNRFSVYLLKNEKLFKTWDFEKEGRFIFDLFLDSDENVWLSQDGNRKVNCISKNLVVRQFSIPLDPQSSVNIIREDKDGILVAAVGGNNYLFHKAYGDSAFRNISLPVNFSFAGDLSITDMIVNEGIVWLASSEGLLKYDYNIIEKVDLGDINKDLAIKSIESFKDGEILFSNALGLIRYQIATGDHFLYNEGNGLPSNTISTRGIYVGPKKWVWVGTSNGLAFSSSSVIVNEKSTKPTFTQITMNGKKQLLSDGLHIPYSSYANFLISSNTFPISEVTLQYRIFSDKHDKTPWSAVKDSQITISDLEPGTYKLAIRSKKSGGFSWSEAREFSFITEKPFWLHYWFILSVGFLMGFIAWGSFQITRSISRKRRMELEKLLIAIKDQNEEIRTQSEELTEANESLSQLYSEVEKQKSELQEKAKELAAVNQTQIDLYQALKEKNEEIQIQSKELRKSNQTISELNIDLNKRVEEKSRDLTRTNEELSKHNSDLLQFSYSVSHNLRGPLARLLGLTNLITQIDDVSELKKIGTLVQNSSNELDSVLRDLTNIIDMRNNTSHIREKVFFQEEWNRACSMLKEQLKSDFQIQADFSSAPFIYTVRGLLQSILYNLLSNAIKYNSPDRLLVVAVRTWQINNDTFLEIKDNGLGIDLHTQRDKIFKLYKRFHPHLPGKGLGLYLVKTQTELLNGSISIESEINRGTTFCLTFPKPYAIERQVISDNETALLYYDASLNCSIVIYRNKVEPGAYRTVFETILSTIKRYNSPGWIADVANQGYVSEADQDWFLENVLTEAARVGLKRIATCGFSFRSRKGYFERMKQRSQTLGINLRDFQTIDQAKDWISSSFAHDTITSR